MIYQVIETLAILQVDTQATGLEYDTKGLEYRCEHTLLGRLSITSLYVYSSRYWKNRILDSSIELKSIYEIRIV